MTGLYSAPGGIRRDIERLSLPFAFVGGIAVGARTEPRFTRDADITVAVSDDRMAQTFVHQLRAIGYGSAFALDSKSLDRLAMLRLRRGSDSARGAPVDLLYCSNGNEDEIVSDADEMDVALGLRIPVATGTHLLTLKVLSDKAVRHQYVIDIGSLFRYVDEPDLQKTRVPVRLIAERGFSGGREMEGMLDKQIAGEQL